HGGDERDDRDAPGDAPPDTEGAAERIPIACRGPSTGELGYQHRAPDRRRDEADGHDQGAENEHAAADERAADRPGRDDDGQDSDELAPAQVPAGAKGLEG